MKALYLDCFSGISGNMLLGGLLAVGLPEQALRDMLQALPIAGYSLEVSGVNKKGVAATYCDVKLAHHHHHHDAHGEAAAPHGHRGHGAPGAHHHHEHRHLPDIEGIIAASTLPAAVKERSTAIFRRLAAAEAKVHGTTVDKVHFHEVGAVDAIVDIVGAAYGLHYLGIERVFASKVYTGSGFVQCDHGRMPVPAPATAELLCGIPHLPGDVEKELTTPTGAAILAEITASFGAPPGGFSCELIGYGAGSWDLPQPNVLRVCLGTLEAAPAREEVVLLEANLDDFSPQVVAYSAECLLRGGALDVWTTPVVMKKGRSAVVLSALCHPDRQGQLEEVFFQETSTLGVRATVLQRRVAQRRLQTVETPWGTIRFKVGDANAMPEYEDCRRAAQEHGVPLKEVQQAAWLAYSRQATP